jgi:hypothetical protein
VTLDLREGLAAQADTAPTAVPAPDLWRPGRRRQVRRALAAAVSAVARVGGATLVRKVESIGPVTSPSETMRLPDRFFKPSPWLEGAHDAGPIGPLVAVIGALGRPGSSRRTGW